MYRKDRILHLLFFLLSSWLLLFSREQAADSGRVVDVSDGDTIRVRLEGGREKTVRLLGINAPELDDPRQDVQFFAQMAKRFVFYHLYHKDVGLAYDWEREDKYGRTLAYIWTGAGMLFNEFIIREGYAYAFLKYPFRKELQERFKAAELEARAVGRGLWNKGSYRIIPSSAAAQNLGRLLSVEFSCNQVLDKKHSILLLGADGEFQAFIPRESVSLFPDIASFEGRLIRATGFLEIYNGRPEMKIFFPFQLKRRDVPQRDTPGWGRDTHSLHFVL